MMNGISTRSLHMALQRSLIVMQRDLSQKQIEVQTGRMADLSLGLGDKSGTVVSVDQDLQRLDSILATNAIAEHRLAVTQNSLAAVGEAAGSLFSALSAGDQSSAGRSIAASAALSSLQTIGAALNVTVDSKYIFSGTNTDAAPLDMANGIPAGTEMDTAFVAFFGFSKDSASATTITASAFRQFVDSQIRPMFFGPAWNSVASGATSSPIQSRITLNEVASTSITATEKSIRNIVFASSVATAFLDSQVNTEVSETIYEISTTASASASSGIAELQAKTGIIQERLLKADQRISLQQDLLVGYSSDLADVDPYETSVRLNELLTQVELSYALSGKIQNLSILRYIG